MSGREKIGVYGGTFDPPHLGHTHAAAAAAEALGLDRLLVIPAGIPPHKRLPEDTADPADRLALARLAFAAVPGAEVSDLEIRRGGRSYTVDTLRELRGRFPDAELYFLAGTDMLLTFEQWRSFEEIFALAHLAVFARSGGDDEKILACAETFRRRYGARIEFVENDAVDISSSRVRALLPARGGRSCLDPAVYAEVVRRRLYSVRTDLDWLREQVLPGLKPQRARHTLGVEATAAALALRWGADENDAREAAILHDSTKNLPLSEQLHLCERYAIIRDNCEKNSVGLLHSMTAAARAAELYAAPEPVCSAIRWHTTGKADMTVLEKIIYLSDYIEPNRVFDGLDRVRSLAQTDLDAAVLLAMHMSLENLAERGIVPHPRTKEAAEWLEIHRTV